MPKWLVIGCLIYVCYCLIYGIFTLPQENKPYYIDAGKGNPKTVYVDNGKIYGQGTGVDTTNAFLSIVDALKTQFSAGDTLFVRNSHVEYIYPEPKYDVTIFIAIGLVAGLFIGLFVGITLGKISSKEPFEYTRIIEE